MAKYLIDVNLPYYFGLWNTNDYIHQIDINPSAKDKEIWAYAKENQMVIITKDSDFSSRIILGHPPPKVIHLKIGNTSMGEFHQIIHDCWTEVLSLIESHKLIRVYRDRIEAIY